MLVGDYKVSEAIRTLSAGGKTLPTGTKPDRVNLINSQYPFMSKALIEI